MVILVLLFCVFQIFGKIQVGDDYKDYIPNIVKDIEAAAEEINAAPFMPRILLFVETTLEKMDTFNMVEDTFEAYITSTKEQTLYSSITNSYPLVKDRRKQMRKFSYWAEFTRKLLRSLPEYNEFNKELSQTYPSFKINLKDSMMFDFAKKWFNELRSLKMGEVENAFFVFLHFVDSASDFSTIFYGIEFKRLTFKQKKIAFGVFQKMLPDEISKNDAIDLLQLAVGYAGMLMKEVNEKSSQYLVAEALKENAIFLLHDEISGAQQVQKIWKTIVCHIKDSCRSGTFWNGSNFLKENLWMPGLDQENEKVYLYPLTEAVEVSMQQVSKMKILASILMKTHNVNKEFEEYIVQHEEIYDRQLSQKWTNLSNTFSKNTIKVLVQLRKATIEEEDLQDVYDLVSSLFFNEKN